MYIFSPWEISDLDKEKLNNNYDNNFSLKFITINENEEFSQYKNLQKRHYIFYDRLIFWNYIDVDKLLYMDCDIIVDWDISELYNIDIWNNAVCAVRDSINWSVYNEKHIKKYFNAWILLINLKLRKQEKIWEKILSNIDKNDSKYAFHDQDWLNYVLENKRKEISPTWNWIQTCIFLRHTQYDKDQYYDVKHPVIYHFAWWHYRPWWKRFCVHPNRRKYFKYIFKTNYWEYEDVFLMFRRIITWNLMVRLFYKILQHCFWRYK